MSRSYLSPNSVKPPLVTGACGLQTRHRDGNLFYFVKVQTQRKEYQIFWLVSNVFRLTNYIGNCCQFPTLPTFLTWVHLRKCLSGVWRMSDGLLCNVWSVFGRCLGNFCFDLRDEVVQTLLCLLATYFTDLFAILFWD